MQGRNQKIGKSIMSSKQCGSPTNLVCDVAISVSSKNLKEAESLASLLKRRGLRVYYYEESLEATLGVDLKNQLQKIYGEAPCVIALCSQDYIGRTVELEMSAALKGGAGRKGVIPVVLDDEKHIPEALKDLTFWPKGKTLIELANTVGKRFGLRSFSSIAWFAFSILSSILFAVYFIKFLGFNKPTRIPDALLYTSLSFPLLWFVFYRVLPIFIEKARPLSLEWVSSNRFTLNRYIDQIGYYFLILMYFALVSLAGYSYNVYSQQNTAYQNSLKFGRDLSILFDEYYRDFTNLGVTVDKIALSNSRKENENYKRKFGEQKQVFISSGERLRGLVGSEKNRQKDLVENFLRNVLLLERVADSHFSFQVRELARPVSSFPSYEEAIRSSRLKSEILLNYKTLFIETMMETQEQFRVIEGEIDKDIKEFEAFWSGVLK